MRLAAIVTARQSELAFEREGKRALRSECPAFRFAGLPDSDEKAGH